MAESSWLSYLPLVSSMVSWSRSWWTSKQHDDQPKANGRGRTKGLSVQVTSHSTPTGEGSGEGTLGRMKDVSVQVTSQSTPTGEGSGEGTLGRTKDVSVQVISQSTPTGEGSGEGTLGRMKDVSVQVTSQSTPTGEGSGEGTLGRTKDVSVQVTSQSTPTGEDSGEGTAVSKNLTPTPVTSTIQQTQKPSLDSMPDKDAAVSLLYDIAHQWNEIGIFLAVAHGHCVTLRRTGLSDIVRLESVLRYWLDNSDNPTWRILLDVIEFRIKNKRVATDIRRFLRQDSIEPDAPQLPASPSRLLQVNAEYVVPMKAKDLYDSFAIVDGAFRSELQTKCDTDEITIRQVAQQVQIYLPKTKGLIELPTVQAIFEHRSVRRSFDFLNIDLFQHLKKVPVLNLQTDLSTYEVQLKQFLKSNALKNLIDELRTEQNFPDDFKQVTLKLIGPWSKILFKVFKKLLIHFFGKKFVRRVTRYSFNVGCVCAMFLIPSFLSEFFVKTVMTQKASMIRVGVFRVALDDRIIFAEQNDLKDFDIQKSLVNARDHFETTLLQQLKSTEITPAHSSDLHETVLTLANPSPSTENFTTTEMCDDFLDTTVSESEEDALLQDDDIITSKETNEMSYLIGAHQVSDISLKRCQWVASRFKGLCYVSMTSQFRQNFIIDSAAFTTNSQQVWHFVGCSDEVYCDIPVSDHKN